ncbi:MAG: branched-chain amino acid ABC transporter permease [Clostridiales Family XIII bacterium]|jgi:branched-chain amino acid transport system permease protein|nr:branched-chain amino acid ABC transporter permease [Clostridiales Family XIII bacterium]
MLTQGLVNGILMGGLYGIAALGLSLIYGVLNVVNFAHGGLLMTGMFLGYWLWVFTQFNIYFILIPVFLGLFLLGMLIESSIINPVLAREKEQHVNIIFITSGVMMVLENLALLLFGPEYRVADTSVSGLTLKMGEIVVSTPRVLGFILAAILAAAVHSMLRMTDLGRAIRATADDEDAAAVAGINTRKVFNFAFALGCAITGVAGALLIPIFYVQPTVGGVFNVKAFIIVVLGGMGSLNGAMIGGLIVGLIESLVTLYYRNTMADMVVFLIFIVFLLFRPSGLLGKKEA